MRQLLPLQLLQAFLDAPNLRARIRQLVVSGPVIEIGRLRKAAVYANVHPKLQPLPRRIGIIVVVAVDPHLG